MEDPSITRHPQTLRTSSPDSFGTKQAPRIRIPASEATTSSQAPRNRAAAMDASATKEAPRITAKVLNEAARNADRLRQEIAAIKLSVAAGVGAPSGPQQLMRTRSLEKQRSLEEADSQGVFIFEAAETTSEANEVRRRSSLERSNAIKGRSQSAALAERPEVPDSPKEARRRSSLERSNASRVKKDESVTEMADEPRRRSSLERSNAMRLKNEDSVAKTADEPRRRSSLERSNVMKVKGESNPGKKQAAVQQSARAPSVKAPIHGQDKAKPLVRSSIDGQEHSKAGLRRQSEEGLKRAAVKRATETASVDSPDWLDEEGIAGSVVGGRATGGNSPDFSLSAMRKGDMSRSTEEFKQQMLEKMKAVNHSFKERKSKLVAKVRPVEETGALQQPVEEAKVPPVEDNRPQWQAAKVHPVDSSHAAGHPMGEAKRLPGKQTGAKVGADQMERTQTNGKAAERMASPQKRPAGKSHGVKVEERVGGGVANFADERADPLRNEPAQTMRKHSDAQKNNSRTTRVSLSVVSRPQGTRPSQAVDGGEVTHKEEKAGNVTPRRTSEGGPKSGPNSRRQSTSSSDKRPEFIEKAKKAGVKEMLEKKAENLKRFHQQKEAQESLIQKQREDHERRYLEKLGQLPPSETILVPSEASGKLGTMIGSSDEVIKAPQRRTEGVKRQASPSRAIVKSEAEGSEKSPQKTRAVSLVDKAAKGLEPGGTKHVATIRTTFSMKRSLSAKTERSQSEPATSLADQQNAILGPAHKRAGTIQEPPEERTPVRNLTPEPTGALFVPASPKERTPEPEVMTEWKPARESRSLKVAMKPVSVAFDPVLLQVNSPLNLAADSRLNANPTHGGVSKVAKRSTQQTASNMRVTAKPVNDGVSKTVKESAQQTATQSTGERAPGTFGHVPSVERSLPTPATRGDPRGTSEAGNAVPLGLGDAPTEVVSTAVRDAVQAAEKKLSKETETDARRKGETVKRESHVPPDDRLKETSLSASASAKTPIPRSADATLKPLGPATHVSSSSESKQNNSDASRTTDNFGPTSSHSAAERLPSDVTKSASASSEHGNGRPRKSDAIPKAADPQPSSATTVLASTTADSPADSKSSAKEPVIEKVGSGLKPLKIPNSRKSVVSVADSLTSTPNKAAEQGGSTERSAGSVTEKRNNGTDSQSERRSETTEERGEPGSKRALIEERERKMKADLDLIAAGLEYVKTNPYTSAGVPGSAQKSESASSAHKSDGKSDEAKAKPAEQTRAVEETVTVRRRSSAADLSRERALRERLEELSLGMPLRKINKTNKRDIIRTYWVEKDDHNRALLCWKSGLLIKKVKSAHLRAAPVVVPPANGRPVLLSLQTAKGPLTLEAPVERDRFKLWTEGLASIVDESFIG